MDQLSRMAMDFAISNGAVLAGIATVESLAGGPPSTDLTYVLPGAKSAVTFAVPLDQELIELYLGKKDRISHEKDNVRANTVCSGISLDLSKFLQQKGFVSVPVAANNVYRPESAKGLFDMVPDLSHRYIAAASGIGHIGLSGNLITTEYGAAVILGSMVTTAELAPTPPLLPEDNYCDQCRLCQAACASGLMDPEEQVSVQLGDVEHTYSKRRDYLRCEFVCGGFTGLHPLGKWSTWSPGRFHIPEKDEGFRAATIPGLKAYEKWPAIEGGFYHILMRRKLYLTCGNCQLICHPDKEARKRRYKILTESGVVVQNEDGSLEAVTAEEARKTIATVSAERRALYENI